MADYKKSSPKGVRFDSGKPAYKRDSGYKGASGKGAGNSYGKNGKGKDKSGGYNKYDRNDEGDYKRRNSSKDESYGYKRRDRDNDNSYYDNGFKRNGKSDRNGKPYGAGKSDRFDDGNKKRGFERNGNFDSKRSNSFDERDLSRDASPVPVREDELPFIIMGRNAVREAIKSGRSIDKILVVPERDGSLGEIIGMARDRSILIQEERREKLDELCMPFGHGNKTGNHQGIVARVPGAEYVDIEDILAYAKERNETPFILILDGITDPYNFGSIIRSAECAGVHGIIIPKRRSATLTSSAVKVSAGAASHMRIAKVPNIASAIDKLREDNIWIAGTDMDGQSVYSTDLKGALALVIGSEDEGLSELVRKKCDYIVSVPILGHIDSLNAAVASAIFMYEKLRQESIK